MLGKIVNGGHKCTRGIPPQAKRDIADLFCGRDCCCDFRAIGREEVLVSNFFKRHIRYKKEQELRHGLLIMGVREGGRGKRGVGSAEHPSEPGS